MPVPHWIAQKLSLVFNRDRISPASLLIFLDLLYHIVEIQVSFCQCPDCWIRSLNKVIRAVQQAHVMTLLPVTSSTSKMHLGQDTEWLSRRATERVALIFMGKQYFILLWHLFSYKVTFLKGCSYFACQKKTKTLVYFIKRDISFIQHLKEHWVASIQFALGSFGDFLYFSIFIYKTIFKKCWQSLIKSQCYFSYKYWPSSRL